jgi:hypothetical protein
MRSLRVRCEQTVFQPVILFAEPRSHIYLIIYFTSLTQINKLPVIIINNANLIFIYIIIQFEQFALENFLFSR